MPLYLVKINFAPSEYSLRIDARTPSVFIFLEDSNDSNFRFYMTHRTENHKIYDSKMILFVASGYLFFNYLLSVVLTGLVTILELPGGITSCAGITVDGNPWLMMINFGYHILMILVGVWADLALNRYMKLKRNRGVEVKLVPWKVPSSNQTCVQDDNYKTNVPINATMIGTFVTVMTFGFSISAIKYFDDSDLNGGPYSCMIILSTIHLPLILSLTIKHHKKQATKVAPTLPRTLQFHEENDETSGQVEKPPERNEDSQDNKHKKDKVKQEKDNQTQKPLDLQRKPRSLHFHKVNNEETDIESQDTTQKSLNRSLTVQRSKSPDALSLFDTEFD